MYLHSGALLCGEDPETAIRPKGSVRSKASVVSKAEATKRRQEKLTLEAEAVMESPSRKRMVSLSHSGPEWT